MLGFGLGLNKWRRVGGGFVGLLDLYPNAAAAYSLRKLRAAYSGSAVRVRKEVSSVSSETDIGFAADGSLDTVSLLAFASDADSGDVFVVTWYDQSLSNNATQSTAAAQPKIVSGGSLVEDNGKAAVYFTNNHLKYSTNIDSSSFISAFAVSNSQVASNEFVGQNTASYSVNDFFIGQGKLTRRTSDTLSDANEWGSIRTGSQELTSIISASNSSASVYSDSVLIDNIASATSIARSSDDRSIGGAYEATVRSYIGNLQELILYSSDQSANRTPIETNINTFYSIYP